MPTPAEQKALAFVAMVVLLGGAVRIVRGGVLTRPSPTASEQQALARQAYAASSSSVARTANNSTKARKGRRLSREATDSVAIGSSTGARQIQLGLHGFPPPGPRIDVSASVTPMGVDRVPGARGPTRQSGGPIDLDVATEAEMQGLPRIGPALARRIVANRDSAGPFGGLEALRRVRGVGAATLKLLAPLVTFSGQARR
jgi:competence protein ComEA